MEGVCVLYSKGTEHKKPEKPRREYFVNTTIAYFTQTHVPSTWMCKIKPTSIQLFSKTLF